MDDPWWGNPSMQSRFVDDWQARFGDGAPEDVNAPMTGIDWLYMPIVQVYLHGVQKAGSFDPDAVLEAVRAEKAIMTIEGPALISGQDMWGIKNMMSHPDPDQRLRPGLPVQAHRLDDALRALVRRPQGHDHRPRA